MKHLLFSFVVLLMSVSIAAARTGTGDGDSSPFETAFAAGGDLHMNLCSSGLWFVV
jgi:hypothetical protein